MSTFLAILLLFCLIPTTYAQSQEKVCVSGSFHSSVNGIYTYHVTSSVPVYYNAQQNIHLSSQIDSNGTYRYYIINLHNTSESFISYCYNYRNTLSQDPTDCYKNWKTNVNGSYIPDLNMRVVDCNDICVTNNYYSFLDGTYTWSYYNRTIRSSIYYCNTSDAYLYGYILSPMNSYWWLIGFSPDSITASSSCYLGTNLESNHRFNVDECRRWNTYEGSKWVQDTDMIVTECEDLELDNITYKSTQFSTTDSSEVTNNKFNVTILDVLIHERIYNDGQMLVILFCIIGLLVAIIVMFLCGCFFYARLINKKLKGLHLNDHDVNMQYMPPELRKNTFELTEMSSSIIPQVQPGVVMDDGVECDDSDESEGGDCDGEISIQNVKKKDSNFSESSDEIYEGNTTVSKDGVTTKILTRVGKVQTNEESTMDTNVLFHMIVDC